MDVRRKQDAYRCQHAKTASTSILEIHGETVRNCKNTKIKNMYLRHHTTVKLEIDRVDLSGWEEKSQEWRICRHEDWNLTSHAGDIPDTFAALEIPKSSIHPLARDVDTWGRCSDSPEMAEYSKYRATGSEVGDDVGEILTAKIGDHWRCRTSEEGASHGWASVMAGVIEVGFPFPQCTSLYIQTSHHKPSPIPRSQDVNMSQRGKIMLDVAWFLEF